MFGDVWRKFVCSLYHSKEVFSSYLLFGLGYIKTLNTNLRWTTVFTGCHPNSICCLLSISFLNSHPLPFGQMDLLTTDHIPGASLGGWVCKQFCLYFQNIYNVVSQVWWLTPTLGRQRKADPCEFKSKQIPG